MTYAMARQWRNFRIPRRLPVPLILALLAAAAIVVGVHPRPVYADPGHPPVVVSLTYDDGIADQIQAGQLMANHGMVGTFYLNSGRLGIPDRMSVADALALQSAGNEIGGHTVTHADLPTLTPDEQARQICNDRVNLLNEGLHVSDFAYPFGDSNPAVQQVAANCGYNSARGVGNVVSPGSCQGCPYAESIPPASPYRMITPDSIKPYTTLEDMENYVLQAEQNGGGWVILVMHHICDNCDPYSMPAGQLDSFLSWLGPRADDGTTVATVAQVVGGTVQPPIGGPPPPAPLSSTNLLRNPSMETDSNADGTPDCWQRGGYGTNNAVWANVTDAHAGNAAQRVDVTSFGSGDRKLISPQDLGACTTATVVGHTYQVGGWYKTNGSVRLVAYYRDNLDHWIFFAQGPWLPTSPDTYRQAVWTTPKMPANSRAISVGFSIQSAGFLLGDDASLNDTDQVAPVVTLTAPGDGTRVRDTVTFTADASDASGVDHVDFLVDGNVVCTDTTAPYRCDYNTKVKSDSVIAVTARAVDTARNVGLSAGHNYTVSNSVDPDTNPPTVAVAAPDDGSTVNQTVTLSASAVDDDAISQVLFYVNGAQVGATNTSPYRVDWDSSTVPDGPATVVVKALDLSGNLGISPPVTFQVNNYPLDTVPPASAVRCNGVACSGGWYRSAVSVTLSATDNASGVKRIVYTTDGTDPTETNGTEYTGAFPLSDTTAVRYRAWDNAGNVEAINSIALNIDTSPPVAAISAPADGATITGTVYIRAAVADNVGIARVWFYLDDRPLGSRIIVPYQWKWDTTPIPKGTHILSILVLDTAGNQTRSANITVTLT